MGYDCETCLSIWVDKSLKNDDRLIKVSKHIEDTEGTYVGTHFPFLNRADRRKIKVRK